MLQPRGLRPEIVAPSPALWGQAERWGSVVPSAGVFSPQPWCSALSQGVQPSSVVFSPQSGCSALSHDVQPAALLFSPHLWYSPLICSVQPSARVFSPQHCSPQSRNKRSPPNTKVPLCKSKAPGSPCPQCRPWGHIPTPSRLPEAPARAHR